MKHLQLPRVCAALALFMLLAVVSAYQFAAAQTATDTPVTETPSGTQAAPTPTSTFLGGTPSTTAAEIDAAEAQWQAAGITSYRITVRDVGALWFSQTETITVRDGQVVDQSETCRDTAGGPHPCKVFPGDAQTYTVPGLFARARALSMARGTAAVTLFDPTWFYPRAITSDIPGAFDTVHYIGVEAFDVLP